MLKVNPEPSRSREAPARAEPAFDLLAFVRLVRRQWSLIGVVTVACVALGFGYGLLASPRYTASTFLMIDTHRASGPQAPPGMSEVPMDAGSVESQVEILKSEGVALAVVDALKLTDDPDFSAAGRGLLGWVTSWWAPQTLSQKQRYALEILARGLAAKRVGLTYVIQVSFTSSRPAKAAAIANAVADAYMLGELQARYEATKRASRWLQDRLRDLREQAAAADRDVQAFKTDNNLIDTGHGLMSDQQLSDVNTQIVQARASTAEAKARLDRIQQIAQSDLPDATVTDALRSDVINRLRAQYLDLSAKESEWSARYGASHVAVSNLRNQAREIKRSISEELGRIAETYKSDYAIARTREESIRASLAQLVDQASTTGQAQIKLRDLESTAQTYRTLYGSFLQRFTETAQQQTFPMTEARVITPASDPQTKSWPKIPEILAGASLLGLMAGLGAAFVRERLNTVFRTQAQVEETTGAECLGILPRVEWQKHLEPQTIRYPVTNGRRIPLDIGLARYVVSAPFSRFAETLRSVKVAADLAALTRETRVVAVVSAVPNEGKTITVTNLAQLTASGRKRVLLIDGDLHNPSLTRAVTPDAQNGLLEVLAGTRREEDTVWTDPITGLHVLPAVVRTRVPQTADLISSPAMTSLLARVRDRYDFIFLDLPPALPVVDVRAAGHLVDAFVLVVEWAGTTQDAVVEMLKANDIVRERLLGSILSKVDPAALRRLETYKGQTYGQYYTDFGSGEDGRAP